MESINHKVDVPEEYKFIRNEICSNGDELRVTQLYTREKPLPKTWEEYCNTHNVPPWLYNDKFIPEKQKALGKLELLRDVYNDGCEKYKYSIISNISNSDGNEIMISELKVGPLKFTDIHRCKSFLKNFADLIGQAKPLL